jgi:hypothetical protein
MERLSRIAGCNRKLFSSRWERQLKGKFKISSDGKSLYNTRLEETREKQAQYIELQSKRGKKSAEKRWGTPITTVTTTAITTVQPALQPGHQPNCNSSSSSIKSPLVPLEISITKKPHPPYNEIRQLWSEICPSLPQPRPENKTWYVNCKARYHEYHRFHDEGLPWVASFFRKFMSNPWWESGKYNPPNISWVWKPTNFYKIIERKDTQ